MTLRWVRKRDDRRAPFDARKLTESIAAAARAAGEDARVPAEEVASIVALFLERNVRDRIPETRDIEDLVAKALLETGHARTADVYCEHVKARDRTRREIAVLPEGPPVSEDGEALPTSPGEPWAEGRIVQALCRRRVEVRLAEEIAAAVERRIFALGLKRIPTSLIREIVNADLAERGFHARIAPPGEVTIPSQDVREILVASCVRLGTGALAPAPGGPEAAIGQDVLGRFALQEIYPPRVADAHEEGEIHIQDLGRPLRLTSAALSVEALKRARGPDRPPPASAGELGLALARLAGAALGTHCRVIGIPYANVLLAPFLPGKEEAARRAVRDLLRAIPVRPERPVIRFHLAPVPPALRGTAALGPRGRRWKAAYGDLAAEAERAARLLLEAIAEDAPSRWEPAAGLPGPHRPLGAVVGAASLPPSPPAVEALRAVWDGADAAALEAPDLEPQRSRGLAAPEEVVPRDEAAVHPIVAGCAGVVAVNCARAAYRAGPGDEPALRREIFAALDLALDALAAKWAFLASALYRPDLPLFRRAAPAPAERAVVDAARASHAIALVGVDEAFVVVTGEPPAQNPAVAALAGELGRDVARRVREEGARRGLRVRLEEPELTRCARRLAELDLLRFPAAEKVVRAGPDRHYSTGFGGALVEELYRPAALAPYLDSPAASTP